MSAVPKHRTREKTKALRSIGKHAAAAHYDSIAAAMEKNGKS